MSVLTRKLGRDLWRTRAQVLSIAAVMSGGVMSVVALRGTASALVRARNEYYAAGRFADVFASLTRAPDAIGARLAAIPGVDAVSTRVVKDVRLDVPGLELPGVGRLVSLPDEDDPRAAPLDVVRVLRGRAVSRGSDDEVLVSGRFAEANGLRAGDSLTAVINERRTQLRIVGVGAAPDFLYEESGSSFPSDARGFGVLWASHDLVTAATGMRGAFNDVALSLTPGARAPAVIAAVDSLLAPYGGRGAIARADQISDRVVTNELRQLSVMAVAFPAVFVAVAAFLVGSVLARLVATEREQIAVLKAFGYTNGVVAMHYLEYAAAAVFVGVAAGLGIGRWFGGVYTSLYADVLTIPGLRFRVGSAVVAAAVLILSAAAVAGALAAVRRGALLPPAEALRPPTPARYRALLLDRLGLGGVLSPAARMVLRSLERRPSRAMLGAAGVACALTMMAGALSLFDASDRMVQLQFRIGHRETLGVQFASPSATSVRVALSHLPGVTDVELVRVVPARLRHAGRWRTAPVTGLEPGGALNRMVDVQGHTRGVPPDGLVISASLGPVLGVRPGDTLDVDLLESGKTRRALVVAMLDEIMSPNAYTSRPALDRLIGDGELATGAYLRLDSPPGPAIYAHLRDMPGVAGVTSRQAMLDAFDRMMAKNLRVTTTLVVLFASVIALGVVYNGARIALSERGRELASLRVLGFTTREVGVMLLGEQALLTAAALPLGWGLGRLFAGYLAHAFENEQYQVPVVTRAATYVLSSIVVLVASAFAGALMYRRTAHLDLVAVLKTRE
ncbi:MAG TPA: ABC transporter permease [Gemmatimonadaceae bacterium]|nr:ABC transporter permease [Gemmatimonadaceae bacterium]